MIFVTGDTHREFSRFTEVAFPEQKEMTKQDYVIQLGDFGIWDDSEKENRLFDELDRRSFTTLFVSGNHSNYDILNQLPVKEWNGGLVNYIRPSIIHLRRGEVYNINGATFYTFGGARSHDISDGILEPSDPNFELQRAQFNREQKMYRVNHQSWWKEELPTEEECSYGLKNLDKFDRKVDYIISHCAPSSIQRIMDGGSGLFETDILTDYFEEVYKSTKFKAWLCGHYHIDEKITDDFYVLYEQIVRIM